jgi:hypothetical protein
MKKSFTTTFLEINIVDQAHKKSHKKSHNIFWTEIKIVYFCNRVRETQTIQ